MYKFFLFVLAVNMSAIVLAQKDSIADLDTDINFISSKISAVYAGFSDKNKLNEFEKIVQEIKTSSEKDYFARLSKLVLNFNDQHLALYQTKKNKDIDSAVSKKNYELISKSGHKSKKHQHEGFWINDLKNTIIYLRFSGNDKYEGYIVESKNSNLLGYCIIKMQGEINGKRVTDYINVKNEYRVFFKSYFKNTETLVSGSYNKWYKIKNYQKGLLEKMLPFNDSPAIVQLDSNNVLIKMHDFSSKGITKKYDSLIKANDKIIAGCKNLIIDIRYNAGGSIRNFIPLLPYICTQPIVRVGYYKLNSEDLINDAIKDRELYAQQNDTDKIKILDIAINKMRENINQLIYNVADTLPCTPVNSKIENVGLIANYGSRSAAELMILHLRQIKKVTTFGENTAGAVDYLDILRYNLPVSNFILWVATTKREITTKEPLYDATGIQPDIKIESKTSDWINFVKKYYE